MKFIKIIAYLSVCIFILLSLTACGDKGEILEGTYYVVSLESPLLEEPIEGAFLNAYGFDREAFCLIFNDNGRVTGTFNFKELDAEYIKEGNKITVDNNGEKYNFTLDGDILIFDYTKENVTVIFEKDNK